MRIDLFAAYLSDEQCAENTVKAYRADLEHFVRWYAAQNDEACEDRHITPTDLRLYRDDLLTDKASSATINRRLACLRRYFAWAVASNRLESVPKAPKSLATPKEAPKALEKGAEFALLRAVERGGRARDIAIVTVLFNTGLRVSELTNLRLEDLELGAKTGTATVRHTKGSKTRIVPLNSTARAALRSYLTERLSVTHDYVFVGQRGQRLGVRGVEALFAKYAYAAKLQNVTPHVARHSVLTRMLRNGTDAVTVASIAGHSSLAMLMRYAQPSRADKAAALERLA